MDTILVATSTRSMGASHTGLGVYEYSFSMHGNTLGFPCIENCSHTTWGFPEHGGFLASYTLLVPGVPGGQISEIQVTISGK